MKDASKVNMTLLCQIFPQDMYGISDEPRLINAMPSCQTIANSHVLLAIIMSDML